MSFLRPRRVAERPQHVAGAQKRQAGRSSSVNRLAGIAGEHRVGLLAPAQPRQCMRTNETRLPGPLPPGRPPPRVDRRAADPPARQRRGRPVISRSASGVRSESRLNAARRTTTRMSSRSSAAASSVATSPRSRRSRVGAARFLRTSPYSGCATRTSHAAGDGFERDQATGVGFLDRGRIGDPRQRRQLDRLADRQHVDHVADRAGRSPMRDSISSTRPGGMTGSPIHRQNPCCCTSRPSATSCSTMLRRYSTLPRVSFHSR